MGKPQTAGSAADELRELIREAHAARRDLEAERKRCVGLYNEIRKDIQKRIQATLDAELGELAQATQTQIEKATAAVFKRFDAVADLLLGATKAQQRAGQPDLAELIETWSSMTRKAGREWLIAERKDKSEAIERLVAKNAAARTILGEDMTSG